MKNNYSANDLNKKHCFYQNRNTSKKKENSNQKSSRSKSKKGGSHDSVHVIHQKIQQHLNLSINNLSIIEEGVARPISYFPNKNSRYIILDTETTGLDLKLCHLVSINAVEVINGELTGIQYNAYIQPRHDPNSLKPNNSFLYYIEDYANERKDNARKSLQDFLRFVGNSTIITHNARFDINFINKALRENGLEEIDLSTCVCTLMISRKKKNLREFGEKTDITVKGLCQLYGVYIRNCDFHHGIVDAVALARVVCKMWDDKEYRSNMQENIDNNNKVNPTVIHQRVFIKQKINEKKEKVPEIKSTAKVKRAIPSNCNNMYNKFDIIPEIEEKKEDIQLEVFNEQEANVINNKEIPKENINIVSIKDKNTNQKQPQIIHVGNNKNEIEKIKEDNYQKPCPYNLRPTKNINYQESDEEDLPKKRKKIDEDEEYKPKKESKKSNQDITNIKTKKIKISKVNLSSYDISNHNQNEQNLFEKMKKCLEKNKINK